MAKFRLAPPTHHQVNCPINVLITSLNILRLHKILCYDIIERLCNKYWVPGKYFQHVSDVSQSARYKYLFLSLSCSITGKVKLCQQGGGMVPGSLPPPHTWVRSSHISTFETIFLWIVNCYVLFPCGGMGLCGNICLICPSFSRQFRTNVHMRKRLHWPWTLVKRGLRHGQSRVRLYMGEICAVSVNKTLC